MKQPNMSGLFEEMLDAVGLDEGDDLIGRTIVFSGKGSSDRRLILKTKIVGVGLQHVPAHDMQDEDYNELVVFTALNSDNGSLVFLFVEEEKKWQLLYPDEAVAFFGEIEVL
jgi:hypothetical protein